MKAVAVILAGGAGIRIGGDKPKRMLAGRSLLDHAISQARNWSGEIALAVREEHQAAGVGLRFILDAPGLEGPLAGLAAALRFAGQERAGAVLTLPADMPFLPSDLGNRLGSAIEGHAAAIACSDGRLHPVCGLWRIECFERLASYAATGRRSLHAFAEHVGFAAVEWPTVPIDPFFNINSADDLAAAERFLKN